MNHINIIENYLNRKEMTQGAFAKKCRISRTTVIAYLKGKSVHPKIAHKIEQSTNQEIKYEQLTEKPRKKRRKRIGNKWIPADES